MASPNPSTPTTTAWLTHTLAAAARKLTHTLTTLIIKGISSTDNQRSALGVVVFSCLFVGLLCLSAYTYAIFYWMYVPKVTHLLPVYLQYPVGGVGGGGAFGVDGGGGGDGWVVGTVDLSRDLADPNSGLKPDQHYNLGLQLWVPNSEPNLALGNFMVTMDLMSNTNKTLARSSRPALLTHQSPLLRTLSTLTLLFPLLLGTTQEAQQVRVVLIEGYAETKEQRVQVCRVAISTPDLRVYEAHVTVEAHFRGLRYFMYRWSVTTGAAFVSAFMVWYSVVGLALWRLFVSWLREKGGWKANKEGADGVGSGVVESAANVAAASASADAGVLGASTGDELGVGVVGLASPSDSDSESDDSDFDVSDHSVPPIGSSGISPLSEEERRVRRELERQSKYGYHSLQTQPLQLLNDEPASSAFVSPTAIEFADSMVKRRSSTATTLLQNPSSPVSLSAADYPLLDTSHHPPMSPSNHPLVAQPTAFPPPHLRFASPSATLMMPPARPAAHSFAFAYTSGSAPVNSGGGLHGNGTRSPPPPSELETAPGEPAAGDCGVPETSVDEGHIHTSGTHVASTLAARDVFDEDRAALQRPTSRAD